MTTMTIIPVAFVAGIMTSAHCMAMCGGFVLSYSNGGGSPTAPRHLRYSAGKLLSYALLGALAGLIGQTISISVHVRAGVALAAAVFMIVYGLSAFGVVRLPESRLRSTTMPLINRLHRLRSPFALGIGSGFFVACGPLIAMYVMAAGTASVVNGALLLTFYGLGTLPALIGLGLTSRFMSQRFGSRLKYASAITVIVLGSLMFMRATTIARSHGTSCCVAPSATAAAPLTSSVHDD